MRINCFEKIKHKEVQQLQTEFNSRVGEDTDLSEQEQKEIGKEIVMRYYRELNNKINVLKQDINPNAVLSEIPDTSIEKKSMEDLYDGLIQKENEGIEQVKKEENEKSKFQNQPPADQIQIIKAAELEATTAINSNNAEAAAAAIEKLDYITKSTPEQIARDAGQKEVDGTIIKRQEPINAVKGKPVNILFSKDKTQEGNYAVIELDDLQPSHKNGIKNELHFIPEAQPRDRGALEVLKNEAKKKADSLDPAQLADNNIAYFGSPIVNARGEIIQGNGRGEAVDYYYHNNQADSKGYRKMVQDKAKELVMDEAAVAKMKYPVLVRMVDVNDEEAIRLGNFTSSDLEDVKQKGAEAKAAIGKLKAADMQQLSDTIGSKVGENDTLKSAIRDNAKSIIDLLMDLGVLRTDNREQYFNQDGVTPEGIEAAHNIVKQLLFEGGANDLQGKFDNLPFAQREAIEKTIPAILTNPELKNHIQKAIEIIHDKIESGTPQFSTWAKQYDMFKGKSPMDIYDKVDLALAKKIDEAKTQKEIASTIKELAVAMNGKPGDLFSDAQEGISFNDAMAENNILFSISEPTTEEVEDMKDIIAELVDDGTLRLSEIQDYVAKELEDNSPEMRDLVATAYHEYGKDKENTPIEITRGVIGRIGKFLSTLFGGTPAEKIFIAKDSESLRRKARSVGNGVQFQITDSEILKAENDTIEKWLDDEYENIEGADVEEGYVSFDWDGSILEIFQGRNKAPLEFTKEELIEKGVEFPKNKDNAGIAFMKSPDGEILGFTHEGKIYLNGEKLNPNTPIHEAGHIWTEWVKQNNTPIYNRGIQLITGSRYMDIVTQNSFYKKEAEKLPIEQRNTYYQNEALAMAIGDRGAQFITEAKKKGFAEWLKNLWDTIAKAVGFKDVTADELSAMTLDEFSKRAAAEILKGEQLQAQEKQYEKVFDDKMSGYEMTTSEEVNKMLSGKTMADVFGETPEGEQSYYVQKKVDMLQDGKNMIGIAQGMWGTDLADYGKPLFNYIKNMPNDISLLNKKAVLMATFLGEIKEEILRRPERRDELKKLDNDVTEYYQQYMNVRGKEIAAGALLRIYRDKYMGDVFADKILEEAQIREQRRIRKAESDINVNDVSEEAFAPMSKEDAEKEAAAAQQQADAKKSKSGKPKMSQTDAEKMVAAKMEEIKNKGGLKEMIDKVKSIIDKLNCK